jgi:hypothetical protein
MMGISGSEWRLEMSDGFPAPGVPGPAFFLIMRNVAQRSDAKDCKWKGDDGHSQQLA